MIEALRPSSLRKRQAILGAAEQVFLRDGYRGASMDDLAAMSGVSKQTVYAHFGSKESLFVALVATMTKAVGGGLRPELTDPTSIEELRGILEEQAYRQLAAVMDPRILRLRRLVIAEAMRFPELGRVLWENGPQGAVVRLGAYFRRLDDQGWLRIEDPEDTATFYNWLVMGHSVNEAMLLGDDTRPDEAERRRRCAEAVRIFLAAFVAAPSQGTAVG